MENINEFDLRNLHCLRGRMILGINLSQLSPICLTSDIAAEESRLPVRSAATLSKGVCESRLDFVRKDTDEALHLPPCWQADTIPKPTDSYL